MNHYLAIDLGAGSGRAILGALADGRLELRELRRFPNEPVALPTGLYWDTLRLFHEIVSGLRDAGRVAPRLDGVGIDTWGVDFGLLGSDGALIDNPRHYRDPRTCGLAEQIFRVVPRAEIYAATGIQFMDLNSLNQIYAVRRQTPSLLENASALLFMPDLLNYFLTGAMRAEVTIASTSQFYNPVEKRFAVEILERLGINPDLLPPLIDAGKPVGRLLPRIASEAGLEGGVPVYATAGHDTAAAVAAVPATGEDWCYISSGTWSLMGMELEAPVINESSLAANFTNEAGAGGRILFLKNIPGMWLLEECRRAWAREGREYDYARLTAMAAAAERSETVLDLDAFSSPGQDAGRIRAWCRACGQREPKTEGEVCRTILYSLAVAYRETLGTLERLTGRRVNVIHIVGGGSRNELLNQFTADLTGRKVVAGPSEATAAGNVLVQAMGAGALNSIEEIREVCRRSFELEMFAPAG